MRSPHPDLYTFDWSLVFVRAKEMNDHEWSKHTHKTSGRADTVDSYSYFVFHRKNQKHEEKIPVRVAQR